MGENFRNPDIYEKRNEAKEAVMEVIERFRENGGRVDVRDFPDTMTLIVRGTNGEILREFSFMKSENLVTGNIGEVTGAVLEHPEDPLDVALEKFRTRA